MSTTQRRMTLASVKSIMQKRSTIPATAVNKRVQLTVQGNGNTVDVMDKEGNIVLSKLPGEEGMVLRKRIYNVKANSEIAMRNPRNMQYLKDAIDAEKAGKGDEAHDLFNNYLNAVQISFGVIEGNAVIDQLANGEEIAAKIQLIETENGSLLTIDPSTISVVKPEVYGTTAFNLDALLGVSGADDDTDDDDEEDETEEQKKARLKAEKAAARKLAGAGK
jgi:hypothetical protein